MIGSIIAWFGGLGTIPAGWQLCDGTNGTPDLRDKVVVGAGGAFAVDDVGGALTHDHPFETDGHLHGEDGSVSVAGAGPEAAWNATQDSNENTDSGTTDTGSSMQPFHALAYIQRMM